MIDLPLNKAIVAVVNDVKCNYECTEEDTHCSIDCCKGCDLNGDSPASQLIGEDPDDDVCGSLCCNSFNRKDGQNVIYKVVDKPAC